MKEMENCSNGELIEEFKRRFLDAQEAAELIGFERVSSINTLVRREQLTRYKIAPRFAVYSRAEVEEYAKSRPGKGGRPRKES